MDVNSFAIAIIDGDGAVFRDDWIRKGEDGGAMAAHQLRDDIKKHLKEAYPDVNIETWHIMVQVVLNLEGLSRKLFSVDLAKSMSELSAFARGFSRAQGLFSFIDVGKGKEQADFKVRETLRLMVHNLQCKHIIFGPCHDKGYIVELRPYQLETSVLNKITLLETTQPPREFSELAFGRVKFNDVFRSELLPEGWLPPTPPPSTNKPNPITPSSVNKTINYSAIASSWTSTIPFVNSFKKPVATPVKSMMASPRKFYFVNALGQRVDGPLPQADAYSEQRFKERCEEEGNRKPCNRDMLRLRSADGKLIRISREAARFSEVLADMMNDIDEEGTTEIPISEVDAKTLILIVEWCEATAVTKAEEEAKDEAEKLAKEARRLTRKQAREAREADRLEREARGEEVGPPEPANDDSESDQGPIKSTTYENPSDVIPAWDKAFLDRLDKEEVFDLITAANFFDIEDLFKHCARWIAMVVDNMSTEQMREYFGVQNDFTPEEEEQIRKDHGWADPDPSYYD
ncbi:SKP1-like protein 19 [Daldinia childiae]|uniref:SKP1-like protein 19 n=1 Tax=Daldinia childiae TaxID=326645 RepID=UPI001447139E|nr:SKP1-like protein 19 [Daldinia childiae]KAF3057043.1 SKP1-like protein 19 [Daldinia childiae]